MTAHSAVPDYEIAESLDLTEPAQYKALFEDTRTAIVSLLSERAATTSELAEALGKPKGTIGHHLKVLERAGLIRVVRTTKVRALEAKYYGRTARVFVYHNVGEAESHSQRILSDAASDVARLPSDALVNTNVRYVRIPDDRAHEWSHRLNDLLMEFADQPRGGTTTYALVFGIYPTERAQLPDPEEQQ